MRLAEFITSNSKRIIGEWEEFARLHLYAANAMDLHQRRDHVEEMLKTIADDLITPQTKREQHDKSTGADDSHVDSETAANAHGTDRAATGFSPVDLVSEFRALRASVLRLWAETHTEFSREHVDDLTRFNEAVDQLLVESMTRFAKDVDHAKDLFLGVLGHDLRNPLSAIMMSATVMMTQEGSDWTHSKTAGRIINAGTRMDGLIGDLLDFTRTRLGTGIPIKRGETNLEILCRQTIDELTAFHPGCVVTFTASGELVGSWDAGRIAQALSNLVGNALQHGAAAPVDVTLRGDGDQVTLTVHNLGKPIPQSQLRDIFNPFKQIEPGSTSKDARSIGLGLFIVNAIVTAHQGSIDVESGQRGTTFTVRLPRAVAI